MNTYNYNTIKKALEASLDLITPAELHGMICGFICSGLQKINAQDISQRFMLIVLQENAGKSANSVNDLIKDLFSISQKLIQSFDLTAFQLLLPEENGDPSRRINEFARWCEGFLNATRFEQNIGIYHDEQEVYDLLDKIHRMTELQKYQIEAISDNDEQLFLELTSFVQLSVFSIYQELKNVNSEHDMIKSPLSSFSEQLVH